MSRFAPIISMADFKLKMHPIVNNDDFPYDVSVQVEKDLSKINFDRENWAVGDAHDYYTDKGCGYPCGYELLSNGLPVLFVNAGGDWENPICYILYWDGKAIRAYIPNNGNIYNKKEKCAFGSEDYNDIDEDEDEISLPEPDHDLIREDIINRIKIK